MHGFKAIFLNVLLGYLVVILVAHRRINLDKLNFRVKISKNYELFFFNVMTGRNLFDLALVD